MLKAQRKVVLRTRVAEIQTEDIQDVISAMVLDGKAEPLKALEETKTNVPEKVDQEV